MSEKFFFTAEQEFTGKERYVVGDIFIEMKNLMLLRYLSIRRTETGPLIGLVASFKVKMDKDFKVINFERLYIKDASDELYETISPVIRQIVKDEIHNNRTKIISGGYK